MTDLYQSYFGLDSAPFSIAPDPRFLFMSQQHQEALATLLYGMGREGGFVVLTGEVGAGKTTICRCLLEQVPDGCDVAYIFNPKLTVIELLSTICDEFRIPYPQGTASVKQFVDLINAYLLDSHARGRHAVLIIDEAQNLSPDVLGQMRLLTNLETSQRKLLQILLIGQPEMVEMLKRPGLLPLAQRIVARYHLGSLDKGVVAQYVRHRLEVSGGQRQLFPGALIGKLYQLSGGVPRVINLLCDRALLGAFVQGKDRVDRATLLQAAQEAHIYPQEQRNPGRRALWAGLILALGSALTVAAYQVNNREFATSFETSGPDKAVTRPVVVVAPVLSNAAQLGSNVTTVAASAVMPSSSAAIGGRVPVPQLSKLELPPGAELQDSRSIALGGLLQVWGARDSGADPCLQAQNTGLRCLTDRGGLDDLRELNLPAVLHLRDDQGRRFYALLTGLDSGLGTVSFGTTVKRVSLKEIAQHWAGVYTVMLHLPKGVPENIRVGERSPGVEWVRKQLTQIQGESAPAEDVRLFDTGLKNQVKFFQVAHGLTPDGNVGAKTLISISAQADKAAPRLFLASARK